MSGDRTFYGFDHIVIWAARGSAQSVSDYFGRLVVTGIYQNRRRARATVDIAG